MMIKIRMVVCKWLYLEFKRIADVLKPYARLKDPKKKYYSEDYELVCMRIPFVFLGEPWIVNKNHEDFPNQIAIENEGGRVIAVLDRNDVYDEGNARLVSEAPKMLETLKTAHSLLENMLEQNEYHVSSGAGEAIENIQEEILNAVAKVNSSY